MFVPRWDLNDRHPTNEIFRRGEERKHCHLVAEKSMAGSEMALTAYGKPLTEVYSFKYLGRILPALDKDWPSVISNTRNARKKWVRLLKVLGREGADSRTLGTLHREVAHMVLLFGSLTWVMSQCIGRTLGGFCHRSIRRPKGRQPIWKVDGRWVYPHLAVAITQADLEEVDAFFDR